MVSRWQPWPPCLALVSADAEFSDEVVPLLLFELLSLILLGSVLCFADCREILILVHDKEMDDGDGDMV